MSRIISLHSFRGGTGKSNTTANIAALLAANGKRVGVVDTDIQSPGIHILFGLSGDQISHTLNDYLWGKCDITQTAKDVSSNLGANLEGKIYLIPSSIRLGEITRVLREGYDAQLLTTGFRRLVDELDLDVLLIDTHPGLGEETRSCLNRKSYFTMMVASNKNVTLQSSIIYQHLGQYFSVRSLD
jgi:septum site-determining protein MinD